MGKKLKDDFLILLIFVCNIRDMCLAKFVHKMPDKVCSNDDPRLILTL